jgi:hypothetical protein
VAIKPFSGGRIMNNLPDLYLQLIKTLRQKQQTNRDQWLKVKDANLKSFAEAIANSQPSNSVQMLDAAFAYYVAGYYARSYNLVMRADLPPETPLIQRWLCQFLSKKFRSLESGIHAILNDDNYSDIGISSALTSGAFVRYIPSDVEVESEIINRILSRVIAECFEFVLLFVRRGDESCLREIYDRLDRCESLAIKTCDHQWWWWLTCTRFVIEEFVENSLWSCLKSMRDESEFVAHYIEANYARDNPVIELWRSQVESLDIVNDPDRRSYCLAMPTGAGKTRVAELMILRFLLDFDSEPNTKCIYIAPFRTLAKEVENTLKVAFRDIPRVGISEFYGGDLDPIDRLAMRQARILIVTPEKLDSMLRQNQDLLSEVRLVVADEGHIVGDHQERGRRYRNLLQRIVYRLNVKVAKTERKSARLLFISGVLSNVADFARWLTGEQKNGVVFPWRPMEKPEFAEVSWDGSVFVNKSTKRSIVLPATPSSIQLMLTSDVKIKYVQAVAQLAVQCASMEPTLLFSASKRFIKSDDLLGTLCEIVGSQRIFGYHPLSDGFPRDQRYPRHYTLLELGVAVHHNDLPVLLRKEIENRIYTERARLVLASPTLAQGVNLPVFTVLVCGLTHGSSEDEINSTMFWNVVGRVGRPSAFVSNTSKPARSKVWFLIDSQSPAGQRDGRIKTNLLKQYDNIRVKCGFSEFLLRVRQLWRSQPIAALLNHLAENDLSWIADRSQREKCEEFLQELDDHLRTLAEENHAGKLDDLVQDTSRDLIQLLQGTDEIKPDDLDYIRKAILARAKFASRFTSSQRRQDYLLGLPAHDCAKVRARQEDLLEWYGNATKIFAGEINEGLEGLSMLMEFANSQLSITGNNDENNESQNRNLPLFDLATIPTQSDRWREVYKLWISGDQEKGIVDMMRKIDREADFYECREKRFEYLLPWGVSALSRYLADLARERNLSFVIDVGLSSLVRYGVPSLMACYLVRSGFSRNAATNIWRLYLKSSRSSEVFFDFEVSLDDLLPLADMTLMFLQGLSQDDIAELTLKDNDLETLVKLQALDNSMT